MRERSLTQAQAAEIAVSEFGLQIDSETLERLARSATNSSVAKVSTWGDSASAAATAKSHLTSYRKKIKAL